jgi:hypothetical protein
MAMRLPLRRSARVRRWLRPSAIWFAFDLLAPTVLVYLLLPLGWSLYAALLASAALSTASGIVSFWRGTGSQSIAPFMLVMTLVGFGVALVSGSDRFLLARESLLTALTGLWFLHSVWQPRPLTYRFTKLLLEGRWGDRSLDWETVWMADGRFRRIWRTTSVIWAVVLLADAGFRVVIAYAAPIAAVPALQTTLLLATTLAMQVVTGAYYARTGLWSRIGLPWGMPWPSSLPPKPE